MKTYYTFSLDSIALAGISNVGSMDLWTVEEAGRRLFVSGLPVNGKDEKKIYHL